MPGTGTGQEAILFSKNSAGAYTQITSLSASGSASVTTPADVASLEIWLHVGAGNSAWYDNLALVQTSGATARTLAGSTSSSSSSVSLSSSSSIVSSSSVSSTASTTSNDTHPTNDLIPGKLYSADELARWQGRAINGPFKTAGDAYENSRGEYDAIKSAAATILTGANSTYVVSGTCQPIDLSDGSTWLDYYEFGSFEKVRDAAFVDLVEGTNVYTARVKELLLLQAQEPCMDFTNRSLYPYNTQDGIWLYAEWLHRVFNAYDYLDDSVLTSSEKTIIDNWFKGAADWLNYIVDSKYLAPLYTTRNHVDVVNSVASYSPTVTPFKNGPLFYNQAYYISNRIFGIANFVAHAGVKFNNTTWKETAAQLVREYISLYFDENGYYAELQRSTVAHPRYGIAYGANTLLNAVEISHVLHQDGYANLFEYKSYATLNPSNGSIIAGSVQKSLEWVFLKFRENFMLSGSPQIYPYRNTNDVSTQLINFCLNPSLDSKKTIGRMLAASYMVNRYYGNPLIDEIHGTTKGNICGFDASTLELRAGPNSIAPGYLFQYGYVK